MHARRDASRRARRHPGFPALLGAALTAQILALAFEVAAEAPARLPPLPLTRVSPPAAKVPPLVAETPRAMARPVDALVLPFGRILPLDDRMAARAAEPLARPDVDLWLLRLAAPERPECARELEGVGATLQWIGAGGWIVARLSAGAVAELRGRSVVTTAWPYRPEWKTGAPVPEEPALHALEATHGDLARLEEEVRRGGARIESRLPDRERIAVRADGRQIRTLLESPFLLGHQWLETPTPSSTVSVCYDPMESRDLVGRDRMPVYGIDVVLGVRDNGVQAEHEEVGPALHPWSVAGSAQQHGTMVAAIAAGRLRWMQGGWTMRPILGMAPSAQILFRTFFGDPLADLSDLVAAGARVSNHSYQYSGYQYDSHTYVFDDFVDEEDHLVVSAVGNDTAYPANVALGKNVLAVGAVQYTSSIFGSAGERAPYSNTGPTPTDGRLKPELVAPGGTRDERYAVVSADNDWDGVAIGAEWESDDRYTRDSGTSFAAPHVTGALAAALETQDLSAEALVAKAVNTAIVLRGNDGPPLGGRATTELGYGLVDGFSLSATYEGEIQELLFVEDWVREDPAPSSLRYDATVPAGARRLSVTLAYTDEAGVDTGADDLLRDDLDLALVSPDGEVVWARDHLAEGVLSQSPIEKLTVADPAPGSWLVRVEYTDSPAFGHVLLHGEQRFAVHAMVEMRTIDLQVELSMSPKPLQPAAPCTLRVRVTNVGGGRAVGLHARVENGDEFGLAGGCTRAVGSLLHRDEQKIVRIPLWAPSEVGPHSLSVSVDGANRIFAVDPDYPLQTVLDVEVEGADGATATPPATTTGPVLRAEPNPSSGTTSITFGHPGERGALKLDVYDLQGRHVRTLHRGPLEGTRVLRWDGCDEQGRPVASGVYFLRQGSGEGTLTRKLLVLR